jgi:uncharacterized protein
MERGDVIARLKAHRLARDAADARGDVDVMVDLDEETSGRKPTFGAFDVGGIQYALTQILGRDVDPVVRADALKPGTRLRAAAENQLVDVF